MWIHRTRRFWSGLLLIVFVCGYVGFTACFRTELRHRACRPGAGHLDLRDVTLSMEAGGFRFEREILRFPSIAGYRVPGGWDSRFQRRFAFEVWPSWKVEASPPDVSKHHLLLPLWPLAVLLFPLWPLYLHHADHREARRYATEPSR